MRLSLDEIAASYQKDKMRPSLDEIAISYAKPQRRPSMDEIAANFEAESKKPANVVVDYARRGLAGIDAGLANTAASMVHGAGWVLDEYVNAVNSGANAIAQKVIGKPIIKEGINPLSQAAMSAGDWLNEKGQDYVRQGLGDRQGNLYDSVMQGIGSTALFMLPGSAVAKAANLGKVGTAITYGASKGGLESVSEGGTVYRDQLRQVASLDEARSAARKDALLQLPLNVASDAVGDFAGASGGILRKALSRGLSELVQETG